MSTTTPQAIGQGPLWFTDENGSQKSIPLSAFDFSGSAPTLDSAYSAHFATGDVAMINQLAANLAAAGELTPQPTPPPLPAILFTATQAGPEGNNVTVAVTPDSGNALTGKVAITATEVDVYAGLTDGLAAKAAIGVDVPGGSGDRAGTGLVQVQEAGTVTAGQGAKAVSNVAVKAATDFKAADGTTTLFTLVPRANLAAASLTVTVSVTPDPAPAQTFTVTATYQGSTTADVALSALSSMPAAVTVLITATTPTELAMPGSEAVVLSGGAANVAATGTAYTS